METVFYFVDPDDQICFDFATWETIGDESAVRSICVHTANNSIDIIILTDDYGICISLPEFGLCFPIFDPSDVYFSEPFLKSKLNYYDAAAVAYVLISQIPKYSGASI